MEEGDLYQDQNYIKVKGTAWMLVELKNGSGEIQKKGEIKKGVQKLELQRKKWKKNTNNRFEGLSKKIEKSIEFQFRKENQKYNQFQFDSLRKTDTVLRKNQNIERTSSMFKDQRKEYEATIFSLKRKEKDLQNQVIKMDKLKEMTEICEQKKSFYDNCVDQYFQNYKKDINKTITKLAEKSIRASKLQISRH